MQIKNMEDVNMADCGCDFCGEIFIPEITINEDEYSLHAVCPKCKKNNRILEI